MLSERYQGVPASDYPSNVACVYSSNGDIYILRFVQLRNVRRVAALSLKNSGTSPETCFSQDVYIVKIAQNHHGIDLLLQEKKL